MTCNYPRQDDYNQLSTGHNVGVCIGGNGVCVGVGVGGDWGSSWDCVVVLPVVFIMPD